MARASDTFGALALAGIAVLVLVAWRAGALKRFLSPTVDSANAEATLFTHVADYLPGTAGAPRPGGGGAAMASQARGGVLDNGFSATSGALAVAPVFRVLPDMSSGMPDAGARSGDRALTALATLPNAVERIAAAVPWWNRSTLEGTVATDYSGVYGEGGGNSAWVLN